MKETERKGGNEREPEGLVNKVGRQDSKNY